VRLLLDTHAFLWWAFADRKLSRRAVAAISDEDANQVLVSAASAWEITIKHRIGKLSDAQVIANDIASAVAAEGFGELAISVRHAERAGNLPRHHSDPFDRMLISQAISEDLTLVSIDRVFDDYGVKRLW
jgi:PIN domain nuclease of toxin-antitoxin system